MFGPEALGESRLRALYSARAVVATYLGFGEGGLVASIKDRSTVFGLSS
jgi:hypothetical protein